MQQQPQHIEDMDMADSAFMSLAYEPQEEEEEEQEQEQEPTEEDRVVVQADPGRHAKRDAYQQTRILKDDAALRDVVLKTIAKLVISLRRELIPLVPLYNGREQTVEEVLQDSFRSIERRFNYNYGRIREHDASLSIVRKLDSVLRQAIFETSLHDLQDLIANTIEHASVLTSTRSVRSVGSQSRLMKKPVAVAETSLILTFDVEAEIAALTARHDARQKDTVATLIAARDDVIQVSRSCENDTSVSIELKHQLELAIYHFAHIDCSEQFILLRCKKGPPK
jgi:hypothetical protein